MPRLFPHDGRAVGVSVDCDRNLVGLFRRLQASLRTAGKTMNAIAGHRIAEVSVHRLVNDVAAIFGPHLARS